MDAQRQLSQKTLPDTITNPKTNKQKLMNNVILFLAEKDCKWRNSEVSSAGQSLVNALTDTLWMIDGHHQVLGSQGHKIPTTFGQFVGYNKPELSKHRKRQVGNLSSSVLRSLSSHLFHCLQGGYWHRSAWVQMKDDVEGLAQCIAKYADYLERSNKRVKFNHQLPSPIRELSENITFQFLPVASSSIPILSELQKRLEDAPHFQYVSVEDVCPTNIRKKHNFISALKTNGFPFNAAMLSYTHGNNVGNLHFVWRVMSSDESSFTDCQKVIDQVKGNIPIYHTRAMRRAMFDVFGRLTSSLKPAVARHLYRVFTGKPQPL